MRDYRFRGKALTDSKFVYGDLIKIANGRMFIINNKFGACIDANGNFINTEAPFVIEVDPSTVGQFTGLQDKNGVDIYEGDVLCGNYGDITYQNEVFFADDGYALRHNHNEYGCCALLTEHENLERIGNIHDNPELIKEA